VLREALPRAFLLENVEGLAYSGKDEGLKLLLDSVRRINRDTSSNYQPVLAVLNAAEYGVPQVRERVFLIASREGTRFQFPRATNGDPAAPGVVRDLFAQADVVEPYRTAWDAIADVKPDQSEDLVPRGKWAALLPSIPEGQNYLWHTERMGGLPLFGWRRRYWSFLLKLAKDRPSWTIQAQPGPAVGPFHWESRRLSMRELCRIQTFPDDVVIRGKRVSVQKQVGNAVPSLIAEVLGREISRQLLGRRVKSGGLKLLPPRRTPVPPPEAVARVPARFRRMIGEHEAHPGTGKGYGAKARASAG
jgi:DNA (cytosine-5)-methyltransferase 1